MIRLPPRSTRTATLFPYTPLFRSVVAPCLGLSVILFWPPMDVDMLVVVAFAGDLDRLARRALPALRALHGIGLHRERLGELGVGRSEEHTSELQSLMRISYAVFCLKKKNNNTI